MERKGAGGVSLSVSLLASRMSGRVASVLSAAVSSFAASCSLSLRSSVETCAAVTANNEIAVILIMREGRSTILPRSRVSKWRQAGGKGRVIAGRLWEAGGRASERSESSLRAARCSICTISAWGSQPRGNKARVSASPPASCRRNETAPPGPRFEWPLCLFMDSRAACSAPGEPQPAPRSAPQPPCRPSPSPHPPARAAAAPPAREGGMEQQTLLAR